MTDKLDPLYKGCETNRQKWEELAAQRDKGAGQSDTGAPPPSTQATAAPPPPEPPVDEVFTEVSLDVHFASSPFGHPTSFCSFSSVKGLAGCPLEQS